MSDGNNFRSLRILIVENHPDTVKWLQFFLEDLGHQVSSAHNVAEARTALAGDKWDVLISDIGLPDGLGWELLEQRSHNPPNFSIAMSGFGMNADSARSRAAGFRSHLLKPFKTAELEDLIMQAAEEKRSLQ
jgi:CheY-like chemotaxis protein